MRVRRLAARRAVGDALAGEPVEALDRQLPPGDAAGEDDRPRAQDVAAVEVHLARRGVDPRDRPGDEDLGAEPPRLLQRAARQLVARDARREAEVVLDPRRGAGLAAGRLALDDDRAQALRRAVHGGGEARGPGADDRPCRTRRRSASVREAEQLGDAAQLRPHHGLAVDDADRRPVAVGGQRAAPLLRGVGRVGREPLERDLVAVEEAAQLGARRRPSGGRRRSRAAAAARRRCPAARASRSIRWPASLPTSLRDVRRRRRRRAW